MKRFGAILVFAISFACLPAFTQTLVSPKLLLTPSEVRAANLRAAFGQSASTTSQPTTPQKHWTKGGKIMTFIGLGLLAGGGGAFAYGESNANNFSCTSGGTCVAVDWKWTGVAWMAAGGTLTAIGLTRRSTD